MKTNSAEIKGIDDDAGKNKMSDLNFTFILDMIDDAFVILDGERNILFINKYLWNISNLITDDNVVNKRLGEILRCVNTSNSRRCGTSPNCRFCGLLHALLNSSDVNKSDCRIETIEGRLLMFHVTTKHFDYSGHRLILLSARDNTEKMQNDFIDRVFFHDIMNTAISVNALSVLMKDELSGQSDENVTLLGQTSRKLIDEIVGQKQLKYAEYGDLTAHFDRFNIADLVKESIHICSLYEFASRSQVEFNEGNEELIIKSDRTILGRVITNLLKNALEAVYPCGSVFVDIKDHLRTITISVHNNTYMPDLVKNKMFKEIVSSKGDGRGLGTYSIKLFTEKILGGKVSFTSGESVGTTFYVDLPK